MKLNMSTPRLRLISTSSAAKLPFIGVAASFSDYRRTQSQLTVHPPAAFNCIRGLNLEDDCPAREGLHKNLHLRVYSNDIINTTTSTFTYNKDDNYEHKTMVTIKFTVNSQ